MDIGQRLKKARQSIGYTYKKAEQESSIGISSISDFENSKREPKFSQLSKLADIYKKPIDFFLSDTPVSENLMLWRDEPDNEDEILATETQFRQLCEQYQNLELLLNEKSTQELPKPDTCPGQKFDYDQAEYLATQVKKDFCLGEIPVASLKRVLEEVYYVKIFYLEFKGSAISTVSSDGFGPAILLNLKNRQWRRSYDLAHELFHILTWNIFRSDSSATENEDEDKFANAFASRLLMPENSIKKRLKECLNPNKEISLAQLDNIAREFDVSLMALIYRIATIYRFSREETESYRQAADKYVSLPHRESSDPPKFPERYFDLAVRALREGKLSLAQFVRYTDLSYKKAEKFLIADENFPDEKIEIPASGCGTHYQTF